MENVHSPSCTADGKLSTKLGLSFDNSKFNSFYILLALKVEWISVTPNTLLILADTIHCTGVLGVTV